MSIRQVGQSENKIRRMFKDVIAYIDYELYIRGIKKMAHNIDVMSVSDTIRELRDTNKSLVRFGDGEVAMMRGVSLKLQKQSPELVERMKNIIGYHDDNLMVSIQDIFDGLELYVPKSRQFWRDHLLFCRKFYEEYCTGDRTYCSTSFSRCYITIEDKTQCAKWFEDIRKIWEGKDIVVVEGVATHNGVTNDMLDLAHSVERIICPAKNAYLAYDRILDSCLKYDKDKLFLLSLGATAKPLAEDLFNAGYRVIDIGNLDVEYEWYLTGTTEKVELPKNRVVTESDNINAGYDNYLAEVKQIIELEDGKFK